MPLRDSFPHPLAFHLDVAQHRRLIKPHCLATFNKYLAVYSGGANNVMFLWADRLEGPFYPLGATINTVVGTGGSIP